MAAITFPGTRPENTFLRQIDRDVTFLEHSQFDNMSTFATNAKKAGGYAGRPKEQDMTCSRNLLISLALTMTMIAAPALAQQGGGMGQGMGRQGGGPAQGGRMLDMDTDGNGTLSRQEVQQHAESVFQAMDSDSDGELTEEEYMAVRMGPQNGNNPAMQARRQQEKADRFAPMDADANGTLSASEFVGSATSRFDAADTDGNGELTRPEWRGMRP